MMSVNSFKGERDAGSAKDNADGRHARRSRSRDKIIAAFKELVREGEASPPAQRVAERAGVGLRTVYRCFDDMESLYRELVASLHAEFEPRVLLDIDSLDRAERLRRLLANRAAVFGDLEPFLFASEARRHDFRLLAEDYDFLLGLERDKLASVVNPDRALPDELFEALNAVTSFAFWRRLRREQGLSREMSAAVMRRTALALLDSAPDLSAAITTS